MKSVSCQRCWKIICRAEDDAQFRAWPGELRRLGDVFVGIHPQLDAWTVLLQLLCLKVQEPHLGAHGRPFFGVDRRTLGVSAVGLVAVVKDYDSIEYRQVVNPCDGV